MIKKELTPTCHPAFIAGSYAPMRRDIRCRNKRISAEGERAEGKSGGFAGACPLTASEEGLCPVPVSGRNPRQCGMTWKRGFTLAEVLITLGVIGIVAALTMPALIANYQKKVLETRIKRLASVYAQAEAARTADGFTEDGSMLTTQSSPDEVEEWWNVNYAPYIKTVNTKKLQRGFAVAFPDGSGVFFHNSAMAGTYAYDAWCVNAKDCLEMDDSKVPNNLGDGKTIFPRGFRRTLTSSLPWDGTREWLVANCAGNPANRDSVCAYLIQFDGYEIKDDYPW